MKKFLPFLGIIVLTASITWLLVSFLMNIKERKDESKMKHVNVVQLNEEITDPAIWGQNYPREYDGYKKTAIVTHTRYGGSEGISKLDEDSNLKTIFAGYAFSIDYNPRRGHYYSLTDQQDTQRAKKFKQVGNCLQCHGPSAKPGRT